MVVDELCSRFRTSLSHDKFDGLWGTATIGTEKVLLLEPQTFMNLSGESVAAVANFYRIEPVEILVAYDEMAFLPGIVRLRAGGGDNGHNGIRSLIACLGNDRGFARLRIGVGHPGSKDAVTAYLTQTQMPAAERETVADAAALGDEVLAHLLGGDFDKAMNRLHAPAA